MCLWHIDESGQQRVLAEVNDLGTFDGRRAGSDRGDLAVRDRHRDRAGKLAGNAVEHVRRMHGEEPGRRCG